MTDPQKLEGEYWADQSYGLDVDGNPVTPHDPSEFPHNWLPEQANETRDAINDHADCIVLINALLDNIEAGATADQTGAEIAALLDLLNDRNPYTNAEKDKLAGLDESKFKGQYPTLAALQTEHPSPEPGDHADVGSPVQRYIEDNGAWVLGTLPSGETAASVKSKYESNADTNPLTDTLKNKLDNIAATAEVNLTASQTKALLLTLADTFFVSSAQLDKINSVESGATGDQTGAEITARLETLSNWNRFTDNLKNKLDSIEDDATTDQTGAEITVLLEALSDWNRFTDALKSKLDAIAENATANSTDAQLRDRSTHTGAQLSSTISDFQTTVSGNTDVAASKAKTDQITVTQAVDLDAIEGRVDALTSVKMLKGQWDASTGAFPANATGGFSYIVDTPGTVDGIEFDVDDTIVAITGESVASTTTYADNWHKTDNTEKVTGVNSRTGNVTGLAEQAALDAEETAREAGDTTLSNQLSGFNSTLGLHSSQLAGLGSLSTEDTVSESLIDDSAVSLQKIQNIATAVILGRRTAGSGLVELLSDLQVRNFINVENGATANDTNENLRSRSSHTGTQAANSISDFDSAVSSNAKLQNISVTQPVDLDSIESRVNELDAPVILKGAWDASSGAFPANTKAGWSYIVYPEGIVDNREFTESDRLISLVDNASTTTYGGNWHKADYTDKVQSVNGRANQVSGLAEQSDLDAEEAARESADTALSQQIAAITTETAWQSGNTASNVYDIFPVEPSVAGQGYQVSLELISGGDANP